YYRRTPHAEQASTYASVNGVAIKDSEYRTAYSQERHRLNRELTSEDQGRVVQELIAEEAEIQEARRLGITVSGDEVGREIRKYKMFQDDSGQFSEKLYEKFLKGNSMSHSRFEDQIWRELVLHKLYDYASYGVTVSDAEARSAFAENGTRLELAV